MDELKSFKSNCYWKNGPSRANCNKFSLQDNKADVVDKGKTFTENWDSKAQSIGTLLSCREFDLDHIFFKECEVSRNLF